MLFSREVWRWARSVVSCCAARGTRSPVAPASTGPQQELPSLPDRYWDGLRCTRPRIGGCLYRSEGSAATTWLLTARHSLPGARRSVAS